MLFAVNLLQTAPPITLLSPRYPPTPADWIIGKPGKFLIPADRNDEEPIILGRIRNGEHINHYETVRRRKDGSLVDISLTVSPIMDADDMIIGVSKIARDITDRRQAQEKQELLLREMNHRIRNLFAVTSSIVGLSAQSADSAPTLAATVRNRLDALARAHALTISANGKDNQPATTLHAIIQTILAPYDGGTNGAAARFEIKGSDVPVSGNAIIPLSLLLYEFATNAAKYGGLSTPSGRVDIRSAKDGDRFVLVWRESGGSPVQVNKNEGFGSKLIHVTANQLAAELSKEWKRSGLSIRLSIPRDKLTA